MKFFPSKEIDVSLPENKSELINKIKELTEDSESLITKHTDKSFIGQVSNDGFRIISSVKGLGALAVFKLRLLEKEPKLIITLNQPFKVMMCLLLTMLIGVGMFNMISLGFYKGLGLLVPLTMGIVFIRFILFGFGFKRSVKNGVNQLQKQAQLIIINRNGNY